MPWRLPLSSIRPVARIITSRITVIMVDDCYVYYIPGIVLIIILTLMLTCAWHSPKC